MSAVNRAALQTLIETYVISGDRQTTAANLRALLDAIIESIPTFEDNADEPNGYYALDDDGKPDLEKLASDAPTGLFLQDDGTYAEILNRILASLAISAGEVTALDTVITAINKLQGKTAEYEEVATAGKQMDAYGKYIANSGVLLIFTLPTTVPKGTVMKIAGKGAGKWRIAQNTGQTIRSSAGDTTTGVTGKVDSNSRYDCVEILCITDNTEFVLFGNGGLTIT